jgi:hypothetical protein
MVLATLPHGGLAPATASFLNPEPSPADSFMKTNLIFILSCARAGHGG